MTPISVIIPSKNAVNLAACVTAIWQHEPGVRIITVDDGIDWHEYIGINPQQVRAVMDNAIAAPKGFRFARNVNLGIRAAGSDDVVICNDDALLERAGGFHLMQWAHQRRPEFAIIGATTHVTGQPLQFPLSESSPRYGLRLVPHIAFVCVYIPRLTIDDPKIGYLDEDFVCGYEDRSYCESVNRAGLLVGVHDGCYVDHGSLVSTVRGPGGPGYDKGGAATFAEKWAHVAK
jgi:glycosyltransferase involved in cell wall biosynthesis